MCYLPPSDKIKVDIKLSISSEKTFKDTGRSLILAAWERYPIYLGRFQGSAIKALDFDATDPG